MVKLTISNNTVVGITLTQRQRRILYEAVVNYIANKQTKEMYTANLPEMLIALQPWTADDIEMNAIFVVNELIPIIKQVSIFNDTVIKDIQKALIDFSIRLPEEVPVLLDSVKEVETIA